MTGPGDTAEPLPTGTEAAAVNEASRFVDGVRESLPIVVGYLSLGFAAGVVQRAAGLSVAEVFLLAAVLYAGSAQFALAGMVASASASVAIVLTVFLVNLRYLIFSAALAPVLSRLRPWQSVAAGLQLTDATFALALSRGAGGRGVEGGWMIGLNLPAWIAWVIANVAGATASDALGDSRSLGFDFALTAMFGALLVSQVRGEPDRRTALVVAGLASLLCLVMVALAAGNVSVVSATVLAATLGLGWKTWKSVPKSST